METSRFGITMLTMCLALGGAALITPGGQAQEASPLRPSHIHVGDCDELGEVVQPLNSLTVPVGDVSGNSDAVVAEAAFTSIPQSLDQLLAEDHALKVHLSADQIQTYLACGDIGGAADADGALIVGMKELDDSGYAGIAYLVPAADGSTSISVMIAQVVGDETGGPVAGEAGATPQATDGADASPQLVDVSLSNFTIDMPTELAPGPVRFTIVNNGAAPHSFVLEGEGIRKTLANTLQPGDSARLNADLTPGTYTIYCPVGEGAHRAQGMELELRVLGDG
ncbi:MAG: cupredoxin domain-containing protein [Chloroflexi bacterium]|nr:cupredoxin domain-containing protein [Chloroflexota bacterium]